MLGWLRWPGSAASGLASVRRCWSLLGGRLSALLVFLVQYLTWTQVGLIFVDGVAGRYFLPLALFWPGSPPGCRAAGWTGRSCSPWLLFPAISLAVVMRAVILRYYLGS